jgi:tellurite resistance protein TerC
MQVWLWIGFITFIVGMLTIDLALVHRRASVVSMASALRWVGLFVANALIFNVLVYYIYENQWFGFGKDGNAVEGRGRTAALQFLAGWLTEYALSVDNIFVMVLIFTHFKVPPEHQRRVLFWGILGALVMRGVMIGVGVEAVREFEFLIYIFGAFLIFTAIKLLKGGGPEEGDIEKSAIVRFARRWLPISKEFDGDRFMTRDANKRRVFTPLFQVLVIVEFTEVVFAVDSIPAIISITRDPVIVFTSNVFAILGLRSLYFALASMMEKFAYLRYSLAAILGFVGVKMLLEAPVFGIHIGAGVSLGVIASCLVIGVIFSWRLAGRASRETPSGSPAP